MRLPTRFRFALLLAVLGGVAALTRGQTAVDNRPHHRLISVPEEDRFLPMSLVIRAGDTVDWVNNDADDHTVVSDDFFNTTGPKNVDVTLPASGGTYSIRFHHRGVFVFFCRFHAHLDADHQPIAPGEDGGIQTTTTFCDPTGAETCNNGTPMMGVITVLPREDGDHDDQD